METDLTKLFEAAKKSADAAALDGVSESGPEVEQCIDSLKQLREFPVTYDTLVSSQVGKKLRGLTKHPLKIIQSVASELLELWKKIVIDETVRKKNRTADKRKHVDEVNEGDETRGVGTNNVHARAIFPKLTEMVKCNDDSRNKIRESLWDAFVKVSGEANEAIREQVDACDPIRVAVSVESVMFESLGRRDGAQKTKYRSILFNVRDPKNPDLRRKLLLGEVKPERLVTMSTAEMASDERQKQNDEIKERALFECERSAQPQATTDQFKCRRCGQRKCTYYQMQTRSADEPMTTYVTCTNCSNRWKFC